MFSSVSTVVENNGVRIPSPQIGENHAIHRLIGEQKNSKTSILIEHLWGTERRRRRALPLAYHPVAAINRPNETLSGYNEGEKKKEFRLIYTSPLK